MTSLQENEESVSQQNDTETSSRLFSDKESSQQSDSMESSQEYDLVCSLKDNGNKSSPHHVITPLQNDKDNDDLTGQEYGNTEQSLSIYNMQYLQDSSDRTLGDLSHSSGLYSQTIDDRPVFSQLQEDYTTEMCTQLSEQSDTLQSLSQETVFMELSSQQSDGIQSLSQESGVTELSSQQCDDIQSLSQESGITKLSSQQSDDIHSLSQESGVIESSSQRSDGVQSLSQESDVTELSSQQSDGIQSLSQESGVTGMSSHSDDIYSLSQETIVMQMLSQQSNDSLSLSQEKGLSVHQPSATISSVEEQCCLSKATTTGSILQASVPSRTLHPENGQLTGGHNNSALHSAKRLLQDASSNSAQVILSASQESTDSGQAKDSSSSPSAFLTIPLNSAGCADFMTHWKQFNPSDRQKVCEILQNEKQQREKRLGASKARLQELRALLTEVQSDRVVTSLKSAVKRPSLDVYEHSEKLLKQDISSLNQKLSNYEKHRSQLALQRYQLQITIQALDSIDKT